MIAHSFCEVAEGVTVVSTVHIEHLSINGKYVSRSGIKVMGRLARAKYELSVSSIINENKL